MFFSIDLFSGIGGNAYAFKSFATPQLYCEIDAGAVKILKSAMSKRLIAEAPVHPDVRTLKKNEEYARAKQLRPLLVTGSWPCQGNSTMGKGLGMADPRSGLLRQLCAVILDADPDVFFVENTPVAATNGSFDYLVEQTRERYAITWTFVKAGDLGFHHERKRFFGMGIKRGVKLDGMAYESIQRLLPADVEPPRTLQSHCANWAEQLHALGNAVVPAASFFAFLRLAGLKPKGLPKEPVALKQLTFDPTAYHPPAGWFDHANRKSPFVREPVLAKQWSTPRAGNSGACHVLTERSIRDLPTQVRFERGTDDAERGFLLNAEWVGWLMGFPPGYTEVTGVQRRVAGPVHVRNSGASRKRGAREEDEEFVTPKVLTRAERMARRTAGIIRGLDSIKGLKLLDSV